MSITRFTMLLQPESGTSFRLMMGMPSRSSSGGLDRRVLDEVGDDLDVHALVGRGLDQAHELGVLLQGQGDVDLVDLLRVDHLDRAVEGAQDGQTERGAPGAGRPGSPATR